MPEGRDLGDSEILSMTRVETDGKKVQWRTTLPSGRELTSEWMPEDQAKGRILVSWCENVRQQIDVDRAEKAARKAREKLDDVPTPEEEDSSTAETAKGEVTPLDYVIGERDKWQQRCKDLDEKINLLKNEREEARGNLEQWQKVVIGLRGETDE